MPESPKKKRRPWVKERKMNVRIVDHSHIYNSRKWRKFSKLFKEKNPVCVECESEGIITPTDVTDHIVRIKDGGDVFDESNCQPLCHRHHNSKSGRESHMNKSKYKRK